MSITYRLSPSITNESLNSLFRVSWPNWESDDDFEPVLSHSLVYVCAYDEQQELVGYVNVAWDGRLHAFLLDTTVHPRLRRHGIGTELVRRAAEAARERGMIWLHVDFDPKDADFYWGCGFTSTPAGLIRLR